ncbi:MAG: glyoxalase [Sphingobium sp.]|jgi:catechol 2,3-dioxygenase-like lactoylglutathione lyase family enzyme|nr:glyoxalase [Sphingobium sp.]
MIGYATLGTNDVDKARGFYDALLGSLGAGRIMEFGDDLGGFTMWGTSWDKPGIAVTRPYNGNDAVAGNGNMIAITVDARAKVDALHAKALELGGSCEGPPGVRGEEGPQAFYGAYFRDLDGNKLCAFSIGGA